eukprot:scaffold64043_cov35-Attheya_sp.AAC.1
MSSPVLMAGPLTFSPLDGRKATMAKYRDAIHTHPSRPDEVPVHSERQWASELPHVNIWS